ncbi:EAL and GGDEF domain-containing protein [Alteromonas facilis]|uniref:sensor domain-containing protein n=1 Tax=Alteromonas facilis TaxID=2048004 RepID=UPI000C291F75|nr:EAL domain-containing protein [Alteromonas facilis]
MDTKVNLQDVFKDFVARNKAYFSQLLLGLNHTARADLLFVAAVNNDSSIASTLCATSNNSIIKNFNYSLSESPCEDVLSGTPCVHTNNVTKAYPNDKMLIDMAFEGYVGYPILVNGIPIGLIVGLFKEPIQVIERFEYLFELFATNINLLFDAEYRAERLENQTLLLEEICEISNVGAWEFDVVKQSLFWSKQVYYIHSIPLNTVITPDVAIAYYQPSDIPLITEAFETLLRDGTGYELTLQIIDANETPKWIKTTGRASFDSEGNVVRVFGAIEDITVEKERIDIEIDRVSYLNNILNSFKDAVVISDTKGIIQVVNNSASDVFQYASEELIGKNVSVLMPEPYASEHQTYIRKYLDSGDSKIIGVGRQLPAKRKDQSIFQMELSLTEFYFQGKCQYIGVIRDISERIKAQDAIYKMAFTDPTSGLKNRSWFEREVKSLLSVASIKDHYVFATIVDIDKLNSINQRFGMQAGNKAIKAIAETLSKLNSSDFHVYKTGEDSFVVLSVRSSENEESLQTHVQTIEDLLHSQSGIQIQHLSGLISVTVSIASIIVSARNASVETLVSYLEYSKRKAKLLSPKGSFLLSGDNLIEYQRTTGLRSALEKLTESGELRLVMQPQFTSRTTFNCSEALIRWQSKEYGFVSPMEFIPLAEESNAIIYIGEWVINEACRLISEAKNKGIETKIAVNISGKHLLYAEFKSSLIKTLYKWNIEPSSLILELTETALITNIDAVTTMMTELKAQGFYFSIDDFGTGYSSLAYLKSLPIDELKIDKQFIDMIDEDKKTSTSIVNLIIDMAAVLNVSTVAEGVETEVQYDYLQSKNCHAVQGYLLSKPLEEQAWFEALAKLKSE